MDDYLIAGSVRLARDERGFVFEPLGGEELLQQRNVHVALTHPGRIRGNHYHRHTHEILSVIGPALVRIRNRGATTDYQVAAGEVGTFRIPPGVAHAIQNTGPQSQFIVSFTDQPHDPAKPDTVRETLIEPSAPS